MLIDFKNHSYSVDPLIEYALNGKTYDQNMTILDLKLTLKYDWYMKIKKIDKTIQIHENN